jgi:DegV family protein with EDD domain
MSRIRIVTDSTVRFSTPGLLERHSVAVAPMTLRCRLETWEESPHDEIASLADLFQNCQGFPLAEPPSMERLAEIYGQLQATTDQIVSIHVSSRLSPTVDHARAASQQFLGRSNIQVVDSQSLSVGLGLLVEAAADAVAAGKEFDEVVRIVRGMVPRLYLVLFVDDLIYLERSGLVSRSQAVLGNMLGIIPFLTMEDGKLIPMEKVRSRPRALEKLVEFVGEFAELEHLAVLQSTSGMTEESALIVERLHAMHPDTRISVSSYGPSVATIIGLNSVGVVALERETGRQ